MSLIGLLATGPSTPVDPPDETGDLPWAGEVNIAVDGNSIYANYYTSHGAFSNHIMLEEPFASSGYSHSDTAISGQDWSDMTSTANDVDDRYIPGVTNVLVVAETTNEVYSRGKSFATCIADATAYLTRVRSVHPDWIILLCGSLPADDYGVADVAARNATMIAVDDYMAANYEAMGADGYVGFRDLPPFVGNGVTTPYDEFADCWYDHLHPADPGKVYMRQRVVEGLLALPAAH